LGSGDEYVPLVTFFDVRNGERVTERESRRLTTIVEFVELGRVQSLPDAPRKATMIRGVVGGVRIRPESD
jgi:hypothetical protein